MSVAPAIARSGVDVMGNHRPQASTDRGPRDAEISSDGAAAESISCQAYEQLMAGETVSWAQILREHPMLGQITVTELVNAGVVEVAPDYDPGTEQVDFRLRKRESDGVDLELDDRARPQPRLLPAADERTSIGRDLPRADRRELKVWRRS